MLFVKICLIAVLGVIFYQDYRSRAVSLFLFVLAILLLGGLHFFQADRPVFRISIGINLGLISIILGILYLYSRFKLRSAFINGSFGAGDLFFFIAVALGFPSVTFVVLFTFSIIFSLLLHSFPVSRNFFKPVPVKTGEPVSGRNPTEPQQTVPLAGYMALFFIVVFTFSLFFDSPSLYLT
ncbi:hypothetical protein ED312_08555 [Sinomicrobium pectinilyticum]|uniref:Prepilin type IV endopeptidase peptidase domain-containing protein n=1 Tax=Sinomicrobium pectinilyticum TaxID=1084421 RepID=A0A3N0ELE4_SINP1|nr:hypothetical protein [Sinomicrobium pectinilyticum]RNL88489.1 hypothetical protein ED312_08555 [Sinomicrobium pectinilyticum]